MGTPRDGLPAPPAAGPGQVAAAHDMGGGEVSAADYIADLADYFARDCHLTASQMADYRARLAAYRDSSPQAQLPLESN